MLATYLALLAVSLRPGDVLTVPAKTVLIVPGKLNWLIGDPTLSVESDTRAIVSRSEPDGVAQVVEVKLFDGTNRLGWMSDSKLVATRSAFKPARVMARTEPRLPEAQPVKDSTQEEKSYGVRVTARRQPRRGHLPDFSTVDAAMTSMMSATMSNGSSGSSQGSQSGGYYTGPHQPGGTYIGGSGSSHKGGTYSNSFTGDHYQKRH